MRIPRFLVVWVTALLLAGAGSAAATGGGGGAATVVRAAGPDTEEPAEVVAATEEVSAGGPAAAAPAVPLAAKEVAPPVTAARSVPLTRAAPPVATSSTTTVPAPAVPAVDPPGLIPCQVQVDPTSSSQLTTGEANAGTSGASPLVVHNCRPVTGDVVTVLALPVSPMAGLQVAFGDGTFAGVAAPTCPIAANQVAAEHRYARAGRYVLQVTARFPCTPDPPIVHSVLVEVSDGSVPELPGAAPCRGVGPAGPGAPIRQGIGKRPVELRWGRVDVALVRCSVTLGQQSEAFLWWYQAFAVVDWGDGTEAEAIGAKDQQGASSLHVYASRGLRVVTVRVLGIDGAPGIPLAFSVLVS